MLKIREARQKKRISQIALSAKIGISQETISAYENEKAYPSIKTLIKIAEALDTSTDYLLGLSAIDKPASFRYTNQEIDNFDLLNLYSNLNYEEKLKIKGYMEGLIFEHK